MNNVRLPDEFQRAASKMQLETEGFVLKTEIEG